MLETTGYLTDLREQLAAQALAGRTEVIAGLSPEDPVVLDHPIAVDALQAYCRGDDIALESHLKRLPFRSPYRDLRQILKEKNTGLAKSITIDNVTARFEREEMDQARGRIEALLQGLPGSDITKTRAHTQALALIEKA